MAVLDTCKLGLEQDSCPELGCSKKLLWSGCQNCSDSSEDAECYGCSAGLIMVNGSCIPCGSDECCPDAATEPAAENCRYCNAEQTLCAVCNAGYQVEEGMCSLIPSKDRIRGLTAGAIAGICIACIVALIVTVAIVFFVTKKGESKGKRSAIELEDL